MKKIYIIALCFCLTFIFSLSSCSLRMGKTQIEIDLKSRLQEEFNTNPRYEKYGIIIVQKVSLYKKWSNRYDTSYEGHITVLVKGDTHNIMINAITQDSSYTWSSATWDPRGDPFGFLRQYD